MNVLVIVAHRQAARRAGAGPATLRHRSCPEVRFWSPELRLQGLQGCRFDMVVADPEAGLNDGQLAWLKAHCTYSTTLWIVGAPVSELVDG